MQAAAYICTQLLVATPYNHTSIVRTYSNNWPDFYGYDEHVLVRIIAYNSKKMIREK